MTTFLEFTSEKFKVLLIWWNAEAGLELATHFFPQVFQSAEMAMILHKLPGP